MLFVEAGDFAVGFAFFGLLLDISAFVVGLLALGDTDLDLHVVAFPIHPQGDN